MKIRSLFLLTLCLFFAAGLSGQDKPTIFLVGDSTVKNGTGDGSNGQWGWGDALGLYLDPDRVTVVNRATGGMSARTYYTSPNHWTALLSDLKVGDYVFIQLGHNDNFGPDPSVGLTGVYLGKSSLFGTGDESQEVTLRDGKKETVRTYGWYLRQYVRQAREKGAIPVLISPIPRNDWENGKIPREYSYDYMVWTGEIAEQENVPYIDLYGLSRQALEAEPQEALTGKYYQPTDHTHTTGPGAMLNASLVARGMRDIPNFGLIPALLSEPSGTFPIKKHLYIIGDSTVSNGNPEAITGWGNPIRELFDTTRITVINRAIGGRSAHSYRGTWAEIVEQLRPGDFVLMGFGHNDGNPQVGGSVKAGFSQDTVMVTRRGRTEPEVFHTYGWSMTQYVREAKAKGAIPILFSQVPWRELNDGKSVRAGVPGGFGDILNQVAVAEEVAYVPLNDRVADQYEALGQQEVNSFFLTDHTHTNWKGAVFNARTMIEGLRALNRHPIRAYIPRPE
jgi:lysophospholipase L1-like esterase